MKLSSDGKKLLQITNDDLINGKFVFPNTVSEISSHAFEKCTGLTQVTIPNSVTEIGNGVFENCTGLTQVTIPNSVTRIGFSAMRGCTGLTQVTIPDSVTEIGAGAFAGCSGLIIIDTLNKQKYQLIHGFLPDYQGLILGIDLLKKINEAKQQALESMKPTDFASHSKKLDKEMLNMIHQFDDRLSDVINRVRLPRQLEELDGYKAALKEALKQFQLKQELPHLKLAVIDKMEKYIQMKESAIQKAEEKLDFLDSPENQLILQESQEKIAVAKKIIEWLRGNEAIEFTREEKTLLSKTGSAFELILKNNGINVNELPDLKLAVIDEVKKYIQMKESAIQKAEKKLSLFDSPENQLILQESQENIAVAKKIIEWLRGNEAIEFTQEEKALLSKDSEFAFILKDNGINVNELPERRSPGGYCNIM